MISLPTARQLKAAGLQWTPALNDFFAIPDHGLDDRIFVIAEMPVNVAQFQGDTVFAFQGSVEWALDYIVTTEAIWLPSEAQLRQALEARLPEEANPTFILICRPDGYECQIALADSPRSFTATDPSEAYAAALLHLLTPA
jgi:hypothetical protein